MSKHQHFIILKPFGYLSQFVNNQSKRKNKKLLGELHNFPKAIKQLKTGVEIGIHGKKYQTLPCEAHILNPAPIFKARTKKLRDARHGPTSWLSITISEGKFRQVR